MDDYTYGGTSLTFFPHAITTHNFDTNQTKQSRTKTFIQRFIIQCAVCAALLAILMLINLFGNNFFNDINQRINHEITTDSNISELFGADSILSNFFETARNFFITSPPEQVYEPIIPYNKQSNETDSVTPPDVSTDNIAIDPELLNEINSR